MRVIVTILLTLAMSSLNALGPVIYKSVIDVLVSGKLAGSAVVLTQLIIAYVSVFAIARLCGELRWIAYGGFEQRIQRRLMLLLFDHVHALSLRFHLGRRTGALQQIIANGLLGYRFIVFNFLVAVLPLVFSITLIGMVLAVFYPLPFFLVMFAMCGFYIMSALIGVERQRKLQRSGNQAFEDVFARATDSFLNYETIKLFAGEGTVRGRLDEAVSRGQATFVRFYWLRTPTGLAQNFWMTVWIASMVTLAAAYVVQNDLSIGDFVLINAYALQLWGPLEFLGLAYRDIRLGQTNVERMLALLDEPIEIADIPGASPLSSGPATLHFENVSFAYDAQRSILDGVTFSIPAGHTTALVGPSGAGKSTIARLAFRFFDVTTEQILWNGKPISDVTLQSLRGSIAVVPQDAVLFNESLEYNIGIGRATASRAEIEDAARIAEIHDFIISLPDGYGTIVGERGLRLSGGQKQRIAIARAVLKRPSLFIFDEATSALDSETEQAIQRNLRGISDGISTLIITHRLSTILHADEIVVLDGGRVVERGRHQKLLDQEAVYNAMWRRQQEESKGVRGNVLHEPAVQ